MHKRTTMFDGEHYVKIVFLIPGSVPCPSLFVRRLVGLRCNVAQSHFPTR
ncbi:MAG: hypothetical protein JWM11_6776 [Planctomycetaceae bacterium]|nr:hypothetical protein [Planctomycetaceae bacterium]